VYNHMPELLSLVPNTDFLMFKARIKPEWEDKENRGGGKWVLTIPKEEISGVNLQNIWEKLVIFIF